MSSSAIFILDVKGKVLVSRNYRGDIDMSVIDKFMPLLMEKEEVYMHMMTNGMQKFLHMQKFIGRARYPNYPDHRLHICLYKDE